MSEIRTGNESQLSADHVLRIGGELLFHFGIELNPYEQPEDFRSALQQLDPRYQDDGDLLRWQLEADQSKWDVSTTEIIMQTATALRMLEHETPLAGEFDIVVALGGARQSNLDRARYAATATKLRNATMGRLVVAGSSRQLNEAEQDNTSNYAPGAATEFDLCVGAAAVVAKENPGLVPSVMYVEDAKAGTPAVLESVFANLQVVNELTPASRVAAVVTQIYQASTELDLIRVADKFGITATFTAGNPSNPNVVAKRTPATYLSEVLRTLRAALNLADYQAQKQFFEA